MLSKLKCTPFCYTQELIDALVEVHKAAENIKSTKEGDAYRRLRSALYDVDNNFPGHEKELAVARKHVEDKCEELTKTEKEASAIYKDKVDNVCNILSRMLGNKFVVQDNNWISGLVLVKEIKLGGYFNTSVLAQGDYLDFTPSAPMDDKPHGVAVWNSCDGISSVAAHVYQFVQSGKMPVAAEGTVIQMLYIVDPLDAIAWLNERKKIMDKNHTTQINMLHVVKHLYSPEEWKHDTI